MTLLVSGLSDLTTTALIVAGVVFLRIGAMLAVLPAFSERSVPARVRLVAALAFTAIAAPAVAPDIVGALEAGQHAASILASEVIAGLLMGLAIRLFVLALQTAGSIAAQATSLAQIFGTVVVDPQPAIAHVLVVSGLALVVMLGFHVKVVEFIVLSYGLFPTGRLPGAGSVLDWGVAHVGDMFALAFTLAAPFVLISVLYNLSLGVINRAMPQLMVAFVGAPAITLGALALLAVSTPVILAVWVAAIDGFFASPMVLR